jgi:hypothetical protein
MRADLREAHARSTRDPRAIIGARTLQPRGVRAEKRQDRELGRALDNDKPKVVAARGHFF